jgi:hypothetical protein
MEIDASIAGDFAQAWQHVENADNAELTEDELRAVNNDYLIDDAHAYYMHLATITNLYYHAKLGEPLLNLFSPMNQEGNYEFDLD